MVVKTAKVEFSICDVESTDDVGGYAVVSPDDLTVCGVVAEDRTLVVTDVKSSV